MYIFSPQTHPSQNLHSQMLLFIVPIINSQEKQLQEDGRDPDRVTRNHSKENRVVASAQIHLVMPCRASSMRRNSFQTQMGNLGEIPDLDPRVDPFRMVSASPQLSSVRSVGLTLTQ
jgi:hypothetical protein